MLQDRVLPGFIQSASTDHQAQTNIDTMASQSPLEIGIVGGGIAGLSAAIALKRAGHAVEVSRERSLFEKWIST